MRKEKREKTIGGNMERLKEINILQERIKVLETALSFYSNKKNYNCTVPMGYDLVSKVELDNGKLASKTLKKDKAVFFVSPLDCDFSYHHGTYCADKPFTTSDPFEIVCSHRPSQSHGISKGVETNQLNKKTQSFFNICKDDKFINWCVETIRQKHLKNVNSDIIKQHLKIKKLHSKLQISWNENVI